jgi:hypothetical protein
VALAAAAGPPAASATPAPGIVRAGAARFEILTPTLIRLGYAADGQFENRPTSQGFGYQRGQFTRTPMRWNQRRRALTIGPARGSFPRRLRRRAYRIELIGVRRPRAVLLGGRPLARSRWSYRSATQTLTVTPRATDTRRPIGLTLAR